MYSNGKGLYSKFGNVRENLFFTNIRKAASKFYTISFIDCKSTRLPFQELPKISENRKLAK